MFQVKRHYPHHVEDHGKNEKHCLYITLISPTKYDKKKCKILHLVTVAKP